MNKMSVKSKMWRVWISYVLAIGGLFWATYSLIDGQEVTIGLLFLVAISICWAANTSAYNRGFREGVNNVNAQYDKALADAKSKMEASIAEWESKDLDRGILEVVRPHTNGHKILTNVPSLGRS